MNSLTREDVINKKYGKVLITLENCVLPEERLNPTPSKQDGMPDEVEMDLRILGCELIHQSGILLKLPQVAMATGQVLFHRFYYCKSLVRHSMETTAMACVCLASKVEEAPRRVRDVINVFHHIKQVRGGRTISPLSLDQNYINLKNQVIKAERRILKELGFCVHVKHPHKIIVMYLQVLGKEKNTKLVQIAWNYMNDSLRTDVFMRYKPEVVACACIDLGSRKLNIPLPKHPRWYEIFNATEDQVIDIEIRILQLYKRSKPDLDRLEKVVESLKKEHQDAKAKARGHSIGNTPNTTPIANFSPHSASNSPAIPVNSNHVPKPSTLAESPKLNNKNSRDVSPKSPKKYSSSKKKRSQSPVIKSKNHTRSRSRSRSSLSDGSYKRHSSNNKRHKQRTLYKSRSRSRDRKSSKKHKRKHKRDRSSSLSLSPPPAKSKKTHRTKHRSRSPIEPKKKSSYDKFGLRMNDKHSSSHKHKSKHRDGR